MSSSQSLYDNVVAQHYDSDFFGLQAASHDAGLKQLRQASFTGTSVLDVGCGTGNFLVKFLKDYPQVDVWGLDPSQKMLEIAGTKCAANYLHGTVDTVSIDRQFDLVCLHFVLAYEALETLLDFAARQLSSGGYLLLGTTTLENFPATMKRCDFLDISMLTNFIASPASFELLQSRIEAHGVFGIVDHQPQVRTLEFSDKEMLSEFIFHSGWASDISLTYRSEFETLIDSADYPYSDTFKSHSLVLQRQ